MTGRHIANALAELAEQLREQVTASAAEVEVEIRFAWVRGEPAHAILACAILACARENAADPHIARLNRSREIPIVVAP